MKGVEGHALNSKYLLTGLLAKNADAALKISAIRERKTPQSCQAISAFQCEWPWNLCNCKDSTDQDLQAESFVLEVNKPGTSILIRVKSQRKSENRGNSENHVVQFRGDVLTSTSQAHLTAHWIKLITGTNGSSPLPKLISCLAALKLGAHRMTRDGEALFLHCPCLNVFSVVVMHNRLQVSKHPITFAHGRFCFISSSSNTGHVWPIQFLFFRPNPHWTQDTTRNATQANVDVNGGVHTARKQHQRKNIPIYARVVSRVLCGLGLTSLGAEITKTGNTEQIWHWCATSKKCQQHRMSSCLVSQCDKDNKWEKACFCSLLETQVLLCSPKGANTHTVKLARKTARFTCMLHCKTTWKRLG